MVTGQYVERMYYKGIGDWFINTENLLSLN